VLESIEERLKVQSITAPVAPGRSLHENKIEIAKYLNALHAVQPSGRTAFGLIWQALRGSTLNSIAVESLSGVTLPTKFLDSAAKLSEVEADLGRFAGASEAFLRSFGRPADSLWSMAGLGNVQSAQIDDLVACLVKIEGLAGTLSSCIVDIPTLKSGPLRTSEQQFALVRRLMTGPSLRWWGRFRSSTQVSLPRL
jgi:hypothetical protein